MIYKLIAVIGIAIIPFIFLGALCVTQEVDSALQDYIITISTKSDGQLDLEESEFRKELIAGIRNELSPSRGNPSKINWLDSLCKKFT